MKIILILLIAFYSLSIAAEDKQLISFSFGPVAVGKARTQININDFEITSTSKTIKLETEIIKGSLQWIRRADNLLTPRVRVHIDVFSNSSTIHMKHLKQTIIPTHNKDHHSVELFMYLFVPNDIDVYDADKVATTISIVAHPPKAKTKTHLIDYSCSYNGIKISGLKNEYMSVGCQTTKTGSWGNEKPRLEVTWLTPNYRLLDGSIPPYKTIFTTNDPAKFTMINKQGHKEEITLSASIPNRKHRLKTAFGFGPYSFVTQYRESRRTAKIAPSFMLYARLDLTPSTSLRAFEALVKQDAMFNNFGMYFAYELAGLFDQRISIVPLLGIQALTFQYNQDSKYYSEIIYPQGFEILYKHVFGIKNYLFFYGMFIDTVDEYDYKNMWIRWGKKVFWELNYIEWKRDKKFSSMWGLSAGLPLANFF